MQANSSVPNFPNFRQLTIDDHALIQKMATQLRPSTMLNLTCLYTWNHKPCELSFLNQNIVLKTQGFISENNFFTLLGVTDLIESIHTIFKYQHEQQLPIGLHLIPEDMLLIEPKIQTQFLISEESEYSNYVYLLESLKNLSGQKMQAQRKHLHHFLKEHPNLIIEISEFNLKQHEKIITELFTEWEKLKQKSPENSAHEWQALKRLYDLSAKLSYQIIILKDQDHALGFCIFELSEQNYIIGHFMKVPPQSQGGEDVIFHHIAEAFFPKGYRYFNTEDDFGIISIREHKMHLHPDFFIKQYSVCPQKAI